MPLKSARALVLFSDLIQEQDKRVILLTSSGTILKAIAPGAARNRNRFGSVLELFSEGEFHYYWKEEKELVTLSRGELKKSHFHLIANSSAIFYLHLMAEIIQWFLPEHHYDERLYKMTLAVLAAAESGTAWTDLLPYFLCWVLRIEGLLFQAGTCTNCLESLSDRAWVRRDFRGLLCVKCHQNEPDQLHHDQLQYITWTRSHPPKGVFSWPAADLRDRLTRLLIRKIETHGERSLKCSLYLPEFH